MAENRKIGTCTHNRLFQWVACRDFWKFLKEKLTRKRRQPHVFSVLFLFSLLKIIQFETPKLILRWVHQVDILRNFHETQFFEKDKFRKYIFFLVCLKEFFSKSSLILARKSNLTCNELFEVVHVYRSVGDVLRTKHSNIWSIVWFAE